MRAPADDKKVDLKEVVEAALEAEDLTPLVNRSQNSSANGQYLLETMLRFACELRLRHGRSQGSGLSRM